jgi:hypothetical protein
MLFWLLQIPGSVGVSDIGDDDDDNEAMTADDMLSDSVSVTVSQQQPSPSPAEGPSAVQEVVRRKKRAKKREMADVLSDLLESSKRDCAETKREVRHMNGFLQMKSIIYNNSGNCKFQIQEMT